jgi:hypothetical protein
MLNRAGCPRIRPWYIYLGAGTRDGALLRSPVKYLVRNEIDVHRDEPFHILVVLKRHDFMTVPARTARNLAIRRSLGPTTVTATSSILSEAAAHQYALQYVLPADETFTFK